MPLNKETKPFIYIYIYNRLIVKVDRVFANGPGDQGSIPGRVMLPEFLAVSHMKLFQLINVFTIPLSPFLSF